MRGQHTNRQKNLTLAQSVAPETDNNQQLAEYQYLDNLPKPLQEIHIDILENRISKLEREVKTLKDALHILGWNIK